MESAALSASGMGRDNHCVRQAPPSGSALHPVQNQHRVLVAVSRGVLSYNRRARSIVKVHGGMDERNCTEYGSEVDSETGWIWGNIVAWGNSSNEKWRAEGPSEISSARSFLSGRESKRRERGSNAGASTARRSAARKWEASAAAAALLWRATGRWARHESGLAGAVVLVAVVDSRISVGDDGDVDMSCA